ncbi:MAG TPA: SH3 domain-containing C40 family peptidase, partial [Candidatus Polarisedimenticolia bacterium]|nr:SH3 domain-containing C40 family peptidase [Candidatus Polarisedimenticolia bacterium]
PERRVLLPARRAALGAASGTPRELGIVLPSVLNMFEQPDPHAAVCSQATIGSSVAVLESRGRWTLAETMDRYRGWLRARDLRSVAPGSGAGYPATERSLEVLNLIGHVYRDPDVTSGAPLTAAPMLSRLELLEESEDWVRVRLPDGRDGWMHPGDVRLDPDSPDRPPEPLEPGAVAATALRFLGLPYLWGGTTAYGLDCSGLVQLAYRAHGYLLPRDADQQFADPHLAEAPGDALQPGDLVFFGPDEGGITHVGLATSPREFVSATTYRSPMVRIDSLDDPYWVGLYRGARRLG